MNGKFRILYINSQSTFSGAEVTMLDLMENLDSKMFQPVLLCKAPGPLVERCNALGVDTYFLPSLPLSNCPVWHTYRSIFYNAANIALLIKRKKIDLVHSNSPRMAYHGGLGARLSGVCSITHVRDYYNSPFQSSLKSRFLNMISDRFIAVSNAVRNSICTWSPFLSVKTDIIYDGIKEIESSPYTLSKSLRKELNLSENDILIGVIGSLNRLKGQIIAIQAIKIVHSLFPNVFLVLAGGVFDSQGEAYFRELKKQVSDLGLENHVKFIGQRADIYSIMTEMDIVVHPPVLPDAFSHVLLEASVLKRPIIASIIGGNPEVIKNGETGLLFTSGNSNELAEAIIRLINNPQVRIKLGQQASEFVNQNFSMDQYVSKIELVYKKFLK